MLNGSLCIDCIGLRAHVVCTRDNIQIIIHPKPIKPPRWQCNKLSAVAVLITAIINVRVKLQRRREGGACIPVDLKKIK